MQISYANAVIVSLTTLLHNIIWVYSALCDIRNNQICNYVETWQQHGRNHIISLGTIDEKKIYYVIV